MKRTPTEAAQVAKIIRKELKKNGIKGTVRSSNYSGGNSVRVSTEELPPWTIQKIEEFCSSYKAGHFNGMEDIYEYNSDRTGPTVHFIFVENRYSEETRQECWSWMRQYWHGGDELPEQYEDARNKTLQGRYVDQFVSETLNSQSGFWTSKKKRIKTH